MFYQCYKIRTYKINHKQLIPFMFCNNQFQHFKNDGVKKKWYETYIFWLFKSLIENTDLEKY